MILYANGDSHTAGHGIVVQDSGPDFLPHPQNLQHSFAACLAETLGWHLICEARSGGSLDRCIRTTRDFLGRSRDDVFVLIGVPSFEREEWHWQDQWYQINASGYEAYPKELQDRYQQWVLGFEDFDFYDRQVEIHQKMCDFNLELRQRNVPHLFFNTAQCFELDGRFDAHDWQGCYVEPYGSWDSDGVFWNWCLAKGFAKDGWGHFGKDAHASWSQLLLDYVNDLVRQR